MKSLSILLLLASSLYEVSAIERTTPFLAFSPQKFTAGTELDSAVISVQDLKVGVLDMVDCHKAILVVDEPETQIQGAESSLQIPFVNGGVDLKALAEQLATKCNAPFVDANVDSDFEVKAPSVIFKTLNSDSVEENDSIFTKIISNLESQVQDNFLVLYSSSQTKDFPKNHRLSTRQLPEQPSPSKPAGLFHTYTFFSQGIFMGLLIAFIVIPIAIMGVFWNLSVQQPQRFEKKQN
ncbi:hypothetical protein BG006_001890 [Podila minutissima]|uniref:V-type proton ATPase subunit S1/VOA1 transmembrane domain-containing protein n=1 Tax=Podila minutissima TaxID=64525 RepID=A0A9P5SWD4_9FUNG|nr:hypothetical protein BG006_001890 [Podila minutissima]